MSLTDYNITIENNDTKYYIYKITNVKLNKSYIGQTKNIEQRILNHLSGHGSKPLLQDIVIHSVSNFKFEILAEIYDHADEIEDSFIEIYNTLYPNGYNMRLNRQIIPNDSDIDLNNIEIEGKYVFQDDESKVFTIGEFTQSKGFQLLLNIKHNTNTNKIIIKKKFGFRYIQLKVNSDDEYIINNTYNLILTYKFDSDYFTIEN